MMAKANGSGPDKDVVLVDPVTQRQFELWTQKYNEYLPEEAKGVATFRAVTVKAMVAAGMLVKPDWKTSEDVDNASVKNVRDAQMAFDEWYEANAEVPKAS